MIVFDKVSKVFSTEEMDTYALQAIDLEICKGEFVSICGPSGGGKSTLLSILATHDTPTSGKYFFESKLVNALSSTQLLKFRRENVGFIFQEFNLIDDMNVEENIGLHLSSIGYTKKESKSRVGELLDEVGLLNRKKHYPAQLSGGQQQRVAIARALANRPKIIFADEPTGNLDSKNAQTVIDLIRSAHEKGATICMVTHDQGYASIATRTLALRDGMLSESV